MSCAGGDRRQLIRERAAAGEGIVVALLVGFLMLVGSTVALMVYRSKTGQHDPAGDLPTGAAGQGDDDHPATMTDPAELQAKLERFFRAIETKYAEYKNREGSNFRARLDDKQGRPRAVEGARHRRRDPDVPAAHGGAGGRRHSLPDTRAGDLPGGVMITLQDYWMGRDKGTRSLTPLDRKNAAMTVQLANMLLLRFGEGRKVSSGWRPPAVNVATRTRP